MTERRELRKSFFVRLAAWGFAFVPLSVLIAAATGNVIGAFATIPPLVLIALVLAVLIRTGRALVVGLAVAVLLVLLFVVLEVLEGFLQIGHPDSFPDFLPAVMRAAGSLTALIGTAVAIVQRRRDSIRPARPIERRLATTGAAILVALAAVSGVLTYTGPSEADAPPGSLLVITEDDGFEPSELQADPGETVKVFLRNKDPYAHTFSIDDLAVDVYIGPSAERLVTFSVPHRSRRYEFYCAVTGHDQMNGKLVVSG
jgi:plastocyanin